MRLASLDRGFARFLQYAVITVFAILAMELSRSCTQTEHQADARARATAKPTVDRHRTLRAAVGGAVLSRCSRDLCSPGTRLRLLLEECDPLAEVLR